MLEPLKWDRGLVLLDQTRLPGEEVWVRYEDEGAVAGAIKGMVVRGAPAIGCVAAFGMVLAARRLSGEEREVFDRGIEEAGRVLAATRPTAWNLFWAIGEMKAACAGGTAAEAAQRAERRAIEIWKDDIQRCRTMGRAGAELIPDGATVLTHCNAGALATGGYGTALGVIRAAVESGKRVRVLADETRPFLQGARLTAWELHRDGIDVTVIPDVAMASLMRRGLVTCAIVGADRIAANGDFANKIGTYGVALAARANGVPFYVAAPLSTIDLDTPDGSAIPIEERDPAEVTHFAGKRVTPEGVSALNPAFDVTPADLVDAIITERGVFRPPFENLRARLEK